MKVEQPMVCEPPRRGGETCAHSEVGKRPDETGSSARASSSSGGSSSLSSSHGGFSCVTPGDASVEMLACSFAAYCERCGVPDEPWLAVRYATLVRSCAKAAGADEAWTRWCLSKARRASAIGEAKDTDDDFVLLCTPDRLLLERAASLGAEAARTVVDVIAALADCEIRNGTYDAVTRAVLKRTFRAIAVAQKDITWHDTVATVERAAVIYREGDEGPSAPEETGGCLLLEEQKEAKEAKEKEKEEPSSPKAPTKKKPSREEAMRRCGARDDDEDQSFFGVVVERPRAEEDQSLRQSERKMWLGVSVAAVGGGALLALTGGAAAPSLAASILGGATAMGGADSVAACITGVFGALGAGISGLKARRRFAPSRDFRLVPLRRARLDGIARFYLIPGWFDPERNAADAWGSTEDALVLVDPPIGAQRDDDADEAFCENAPSKSLSSSWEELQLKSALRQHQHQSDDDDDDAKGGSDASPGGLDLDLDSSSAPGGGGPPPRRRRRPDPASASAKKEELDWWSESGHQSFETAEVVAWEEEALERLYVKMTETTLLVQARDRAARSVADEILRRSALGAASLPLALLENAAALDDPWAIAIRRAKAVGKRLADELLKQLPPASPSSSSSSPRNNTKGGATEATTTATTTTRPVTLVGYSIGARVVVHCLEALDDFAATRGDARALGLVENAVLLGAPVAATPKRWVRARRAVAGRLVNGFSKRDWMLRLVYRTKAWSIAGVAGAEPVRAREDDDVAPRVENLDLSDIVNSHLAYPHLMQPIFARLGLET